MPLYEVAILEHPTKKDAEEGSAETLVFGPKPVIARDAESAAIAAVMDEQIKVEWQRMEVLVRPFV